MTAGADDLGVLSFIVSAVGALGPRAHRPSDEPESLKVHLGGLTSRGNDAADEHVDWLPETPLKIGDRITLEILETDSPDPIDHAELAIRREADARAYYEHCKETYLSMRAQFEPEA